MLFAYIIVAFQKTFMNFFPIIYYSQINSWRKRNIWTFQNYVKKVL